MAEKYGYVDFWVVARAGLMLVGFQPHNYTVQQHRNPRLLSL